MQWTGCRAEGMNGVPLRQGSLSEPSRPCMPLLPAAAEPPFPPPDLPWLSLNMFFLRSMMRSEPVGVSSPTSPARQGGGGGGGGNNSILLLVWLSSAASWIAVSHEHSPCMDQYSPSHPSGC